MGANPSCKLGDVFNLEIWGQATVFQSCLIVSARTMMLKNIPCRKSQEEAGSEICVKNQGTLDGFA